MNNIDSGQVWYYYDVPEKQDRVATDEPVSQIPVLNGVPHEPEAKPVPRRGGEDINSKYIKLAKAGGRKDLLLYNECKAGDEMKEYARVDWFDHPDTKPDTNVGRSRPRPMQVIKDTKKSTVSMITANAPYTTDEIWGPIDEEDREQYLTLQAQKQRILNRKNIPPPPLPPAQPATPTKRVDKPPLGENGEPVSFTHLLSHGYQADWTKNMTETRKQKMENKRRDERQQKEKLTQHLNSYKKNANDVSDKPLFKMKKFANASPRIVNS